MRDPFVWLLLIVPGSVAVAYATSPQSVWTFAAAVVGIVLLAEWIRRATTNLADRAGPAIGGLLNVSFGNTAEFVLALFVLAAGKPDIVKSQLTGSIIGNGLLGLGLAIVLGSIGRERQTFKRERAGQLASLLVLSMIALLLPALVNYVIGGAAANVRRRLDEHLSLGVSAVLIVVYGANLVYTLITHRDVFAFAHAPEVDSRGGRGRWPAWAALSVLAAGTTATALEAHYVAGALTGAAAALGLSEFFLGVILLALIGNAAEYVSAAYFARQDRLGLALSITVGSTIQIALLVAPLLVIVSAWSSRPMDLVFSSPLELIAIAAVTFAVSAVTQDAETTWFEGLLLLAVYLLLALAFYFV